LHFTYYCDTIYIINRQDNERGLLKNIFDVSLPVLPKKMELKLPNMNKIKMPKKITHKKV